MDQRKESGTTLHDNHILKRATTTMIKVGIQSCPETETKHFTHSTTDRKSLQQQNPKGRGVVLLPARQVLPIHFAEGVTADRVMVK